jgi:26S proteasome regulatory subunit N5
VHSTSRILLAIVKFCYQCGNLDALNENIHILSKKRSQLKQVIFYFIKQIEIHCLNKIKFKAVTKMVQEACIYVDQINDMEQKLKLIDTLRTVTAGKIYVEIERARLTKKLAAFKESQGNIDEAATILQELQVETYGSMEKREKIEFLLEQMRICLLKGDFIRTQIISRKISIRAFEDETFHVSLQ